LLVKEVKEEKEKEFQGKIKNHHSQGLLEQGFK
jgi:HKD family nuclease